MMQKKKKGGRRGEGRLSSAIFGTVSVAVFFLIIKDSELAIDYMNKGMKLCVNTVIPSLFPFMVVSELIVSSGAADILGRAFGGVFRALFGISSEGGSAYLLGTVCGFPVGCRSALSLYTSGRISQSDLSRLICFSNNPSSAFIISAVGGTLFGCRAFGVALWCITLLSSLIMGVLHKLLCLGDDEKYGVHSLKEAEDRLGFSEEKEIVGQKREGIVSFSYAVTSAATAMLGVCAFIIFFSVFTGLADNVLVKLGASQGVRAWVLSFFELTGGVASAAGVKPVLLAALIASFGVGWSGISVHLQVASFCDGVKIEFGRYVASKFIQGVLNVLMTYLYLCFFGDRLSFDSKSVAAFESISVEGGELGTFVSAVFFSVLLVNFFSLVKRHISSQKCSR